MNPAVYAVVAVIAILFITLTLHTAASFFVFVSNATDSSSKEL